MQTFVFQKQAAALFSSQLKAGKFNQKQNIYNIGDYFYTAPSW